MGRRLEFTHVFEDGSGDGMLSIDPEATDDAKIRVDLEDGGKIWLSANRAGWLHLARICAELGLAGYEPGYHFHMDFDFRLSTGDGPEISFEIDDLKLVA